MKVVSRLYQVQTFFLHTYFSRWNYNVFNSRSDFLIYYGFYAIIHKLKIHNINCYRNII